MEKEDKMEVVVTVPELTAEEYKNQGNDAFKVGNFEKAISLYS